MTRLVDVLRKLDDVETKLRTQLAMVVELRQSLVAKAMMRETGRCGKFDLMIAQGQAARGDYDKMLRDLTLETGDAEVGG